ncbi:unnamed protein product, partial [Phaeothamnion confervicola]
MPRKTFTPKKKEGSTTNFAQPALPQVAEPDDDRHAPNEEAWDAGEVFVEEEEDGEEGAVRQPKRYKRAKEIAASVPEGGTTPPTLGLVQLKSASNRAVKRLIPGRHVAVDGESFVRLVEGIRNSKVVADDEESPKKPIGVGVFAAVGDEAVQGSEANDGDGSMALTLPEASNLAGILPITTALFNALAEVAREGMVGLRLRSGDGASAKKSVEVLLLEPAFNATLPGNIPPITRRSLRALRKVIAWLKPEALAAFVQADSAASTASKASPPSAAEFYAAVEAARSADPAVQRALVDGCELPPMPELEPTLRRYQQAAVAFMV